MEYKVLNNGIKMPKMALGTFKLDVNDENEAAIVKALNLGFRHIDTATWYHNEDMVGKAVKKSGIKREEIFITTKLNNDTRGYDETKKAIELSLMMLGVEYLDLYLLHWPAPVKFRHDYNNYNLQSWRAMEEYYKLGKIKAIGVSNFMVHHFEGFYDEVEIKPMVNQIEIHPGYCDEDVVEYCHKHDIAIVAYSPLGRGNLIDDDRVKMIAESLKKSPSQVLISYIISQYDACIVRSTNQKHLIDNLNVDFILDEKTIKILASDNDKANRLSKDPDNSNQ